MKILSTEKNIKAGIIISYATLAINVLISIVYTPFLLSHIGQSQYGLTSFVNSITTWFTVVSSALVSSFVRFATREYARRNDDGVKEVNAAFFLMFSVISLFIMVFGVGLFFVMKYAILPNSVYADDPDLMNLILILTVISLASMAISVPGNIFGLFNNWKQRFIVAKGIALFVNVLQPLCTIPFLLLGCDVITVVLVQLVFTIVGIALHFFFAIKAYGFGFKRPLFSVSKDLIKEVAVFSSFIILSAVVDQINSSVDKTILGFMVDDKGKSVAVYQTGTLFNSYLMTLSISISTAFSTKISEACTAGDLSRMNRIFRSVSKLQSLVILFIVGGFATFGQSFIKLWLGDGYEMSFYVTLVLFVLHSVPYTENVSVEAQRALNKHKFRSVLYMLTAILNIVLTLIFVFFFDKEDAIFGCLIGTAVSNVIGYWIAINVYNAKVVRLDIRGYALDWIKIALAAATCCLLTLGFIRLSALSDPAVVLMVSSILYISFFVTFVLLFERNFLSSFFRKGEIDRI